MEEIETFWISFFVALDKLSTLCSEGSADKIKVFDFKMNYKLLSPSSIPLYTPTFLSTMLQICS